MFCDICYKKPPPHDHSVDDCPYIVCRLCGMQGHGAFTKECPLSEDYEPTPLTITKRSTPERTGSLNESPQPKPVPMECEPEHTTDIPKVESSGALDKEMPSKNVDDEPVVSSSKNEGKMFELVFKDGYRILTENDWQLEKSTIKAFSPTNLQNILALKQLIFDTAEKFRNEIINCRILPHESTQTNLLALLGQVDINGIRSGPRNDWPISRHRTYTMSLLDTLQLLKVSVYINPIPDAPPDHLFPRGWLNCRIVDYYMGILNKDCSLRKAYMIFLTTDYQESLEFVCGGPLGYNTTCPGRLTCPLLNKIVAKVQQSGDRMFHTAADVFSQYVVPINVHANFWVLVHIRMDKDNNELVSIFDSSACSMIEKQTLQQALDSRIRKLVLHMRYVERVYKYYGMVNEIMFNNPMYIPSADFQYDFAETPYHRDINSSCIYTLMFANILTEQPLCLSKWRRVLSDMETSQMRKLLVRDILCSRKWTSSNECARVRNKKVPTYFD